MERELVISHSIYLNKEQRYMLYNDNNTIETKGKCLSVWKKGTKTNEPCEAVEQDYIITNIKGVIVQKTDKYKISLPNYEARTGLLDPKDGGCKHFQLAYKEITTVDEKPCSIFHYIIIDDYDIMINSAMDETQ